MNKQLYNEDLENRYNEVFNEDEFYDTPNDNIKSGVTELTDEQAKNLVDSIFDQWSGNKLYGYEPDEILYSESEDKYAVRLESRPNDHEFGTTLKILNLSGKADWSAQLAPYLRDFQIIDSLFGYVRIYRF